MRGWITLFALAGVVGLMLASPASAQVAERSHYNPYTGNTTKVAAAYNPYTGSYKGGTTATNPNTGTEEKSKSYYNPATGKTDHVQGAYNPYTGKYAYHYSSRR